MIRAGGYVSAGAPTLLLMACVLAGMAWPWPARGQETSFVVEGVPAGKLKDLIKAYPSATPQLKNLGGGSQVLSVSGESPVGLQLRQLATDYGGSVAEWRADYTSLLVPASLAELTEAQQERVSGLSASRLGVKTSIVKLAPEALRNYALQKGFGVADRMANPKSFSIGMPGDDVVQASRSSIEKTAQRTVWEGHVDGGDTLLISDPAGVRGSIRSGDSVKVIFPVGGDYSAISEYSFRKLPPEHPEGIEADDDSGSNGELMDKPKPEPIGLLENVTIDLLVVYTAEAAGLYADAEDLALDLAVEEANRSFVTSRIGGLKLRVVRAYKGSLPEDGDWEEYMDRLVGTGDGYLDEVHVEREKYKADVVVLLVADDSSCGYAKKVFATKKTAFAVVNMQCAVVNYSLAHEIGHLIGARHDVCVEKRNDPFRYGHGYITPDNSWRTLMAYGDCCASCVREGVWSSPSLTHKGVPAGNNDLANDARVISEYAKRVSRFMQ